MAEKLMPFIGRDAFRLKVPPHFAKPKYSVDGVLKDESEWGADWTDFSKLTPEKLNLLITFRMLHYFLLGWKKLVLMKNLV